MVHGYGGLTVSGNTTATVAPNAAAAHTQGWAANSLSQHGNQSVEADTDNSRLNLKPGRYLILASAVIELEDISGTSGDDAGILTAQLYKGGSAIGGALAKSDHQDSDRPQTVNVHAVVEITKDNVDNSVNYVDLRLSSGDSSGNDVTVSDAKLDAIRIDDV